MPGLTKTLQTIALDGHIKLIDSPGVMFSGGRAADGSVDSNMILRNCLRFEQLEDPVGVVYKIVERCTEQQLRECYDLGPAGQDVLEFDADQFLIQVAHKRGKLGRGGVPDLAAAAKIVIKDWNDGKIAYCTEPPRHEEDLRGEAVVVQQFAPEINRKDPLAAQSLQHVRVEVDEADRQRVEALARAQAEAASHPLGSRPLYSDVQAAPVVEGEVEMGEDGEPRSTIVTRPRQAAPASAASAAGVQEEDEDGMAEDSAAASTYAASSSSAAAVPSAYSAPRPKAANQHNPQSNQQSKKKQKSTKKKMRKTANRAAAAAGAGATGASGMEFDGGAQDSADIAVDDDQDL